VRINDYWAHRLLCGSLACFAVAFTVLLCHNVYLRVSGARASQPPPYEDDTAAEQAHSFTGAREELYAATRTADYYANEINDDPVTDVAEPNTSEWVAVWAVTTAYSPHAQSCYPYDDGLTSTGVNTKVSPWGIAACPSVIPYGTRIVVPGYKPSRHYDDEYAWPVDDTGAAMRRAARDGVIHLDLRYIHQASAMRYGRHRKVVFIDVSGMDERQRRWVWNRRAYE